MAKQFWSFIISYTTRNAIKRKGAVAELSVSDAIPEILSFYVSLIVSMVIKSLSLNKLFLLNPPLKKGDIGGFAPGCLEKSPLPPLYKGGKIICG